MPSLSRLLSFALILSGAIVLSRPGPACGQTPDVKAKNTGSISGRVTAGEKPLAGIPITAGGSNHSISDTDGRYRLDGLAAGEIVVTPAAPLYVMPNTMMGRPGKIVSLSAGETVEGIDFKLTRGGVITGRVTDANARPVIEERISLLPVDETGAPLRQQFPQIWNYQMYQTDDRGIFRIYGLPAGRYKVSAGNDAGSASILNSLGSYARTYYPDTTDQAKASVVELSEGGETKDIDIHLGRRAATYSVSGRIVDADTGKALPGIRFGFGVIQKNQSQSYISGTASPGAPTNSQGEFRLEGVEPGRYGVFVSSEGFGFNPNAGPGPNVYSDPVMVEVIDSDVTNVEIKAQRGVALSGILVPEGITDKKVLAGLATLRIGAYVRPSASGSIQVAAGGRGVSSVGADGSFRIEGLRPGKASLYLSGTPGGVDLKGVSIGRIERDGVRLGQGIDIQAGEDTVGVRVYLRYGTGTIRGEIKFEGETLPSDAIIFIMFSRDGMPNQSSTPVDSRGHFVIQNLAAGTYQIILQVASLGASTPVPRGLSRRQQQEVTVTDATETEVKFTLDLNRKDAP